MKESDFTDFVDRELRRLLLGDRLGAGIARAVYVSAADPTKVIKIEGGHKSFQNIHEWEIWQSVKDTPLAKWFAPCHDISAAGAVLIQSRAEDIKAFPSEVPDFFTDLKLANFGRIGKQFVARDYGMMVARLIYVSTRRRLPMRKVKRTDATGWAIT